MTKLDVIDGYWDYLLVEGRRPQSVYALSKSLGLDEAEFYAHFGSFEVLEAEYWESTVAETLLVLEGDGDYPDYPADQKLLAFFYTYISHIQKSRSRFVECFPQRLGIGHRSLKGMKRVFVAFANGIVAAGVGEGQFADRKKLNNHYPQMLFLHFLAVIKFYLRDGSEGFEDTDAFIEKSVQLGGQLAAHGVLESGFDLLRFLVGKDDRLKNLTKVLSKFIPQ